MVLQEKPNSSGNDSEEADGPPLENVRNTATKLIQLNQALQQLHSTLSCTLRGKFSQLLYSMIICRVKFKMHYIHMICSHRQRQWGKLQFVQRHNPVFDQDNWQCGLWTTQTDGYPLFWQPTASMLTGCYGCTGWSALSTVLTFSIVWAEVWRKFAHVCRRSGGRSWYQKPNRP